MCVIERKDFIATCNNVFERNLLRYRARIGITLQKVINSVSHGGASRFRLKFTVSPVLREQSHVSIGDTHPGGEIK